MTETTPSSMSALLSADTTADAERVQVETWRQMSPAEKLGLVSAATRAALNLSLSGIRHRHPEVSDRECFLRLAAIMIGEEAARRVYPEARALSDLRGR